MERGNKQLVSLWLSFVATFLLILTFFAPNLTHSSVCTQLGPTVSSVNSDAQLGSINSQIVVNQQQPIVSFTAEDKQSDSQRIINSDFVNLGDTNLVLMTHYVLDSNSESSSQLRLKLVTSVGIYNYLNVPLGNVVEMNANSGYSKIELLDQKNLSSGFIISNQKNQFTKFSFLANYQIQEDFTCNLSDSGQFPQFSNLSFIFLPGTYTVNNAVENVIYLFATRPKGDEIRYWIYDLKNGGKLMNQWGVVRVSSWLANFDQMVLVKNFSFNGFFHAFVNLQVGASPSGWIYLTNSGTSTGMRDDGQVMIVNAPKFQSRLVTVGWNPWTTVDSFFGQVVTENQHFFYFFVSSTVSANQFTKSISWLDDNESINQNNYIQQILFVNSQNAPKYQGLWVITNHAKSVNFINPNQEFGLFGDGPFDFLQNTVSTLLSDSKQVFNADKDNIGTLNFISFNTKINRLMIFYNHQSTLASYNLAVGGVPSLNIVPVSINFEKYKLLLSKLQSEFSSYYARSENNAILNSLLDIAGYYGQLYVNNRFGLLLHANDLVGTLEIKLQIFDPYFDKQITTIFKNYFFGFKKIAPSGLTSHIVNGPSPLFGLTPMELYNQLNDESPLASNKNLTVGDYIKKQIFNLFGFNSEYQNLNYTINISDMNVLGHVELMVSFQTIFYERVGAIYDNDNNQQSLTPAVDQKTTAPNVTKSEGAHWTNASVVTTSNSDQSVISFRHGFMLKMEKWFVPVLVISGIIVIFLIGLVLWIQLGSRLKKKFFGFFEHRDDEDLSLHSALKPLSTLQLTSARDEFHKRGKVVSTFNQLPPAKSTLEHLKAYDRFKKFISEINQPKQLSSSNVQTEKF